MKVYRLALVFVPVFLLVMGVFGAAPGSLDPTFGVGGKLNLNIPGFGYILSAASQPDGKLLLAGAWQTGANRDFIIIRLTSDGTYDTTFDGDGIVMTDFSGRYDDINDIAVQSDGKIVVAGTSIATSGFSDSAFARYLPDGSLDSAFDGDGRVLMTNFPDQSGDLIRSIALQPDGKIVGGGSASGAFLLFRLSLDGSLDATFGNSGVVVTNAGTFVRDIRTVAILPTGKILAAGGSGRSVVVRYEANGTVDAAFGSGGIFISDTGYYAQSWAMAISADGKIVLAGQASPGPQYDSFVARLSPLGIPDVSFGTNGFKVTNINPTGADSFTDVSIQSDGRIVAAGSSGASQEYDFCLARYNSNGALDASFAVDGISVRDISGEDILNSAIIVGDKMIGVGSPQTSSGIIAARYNLEVTPSSSSDFDGDGFSDVAVFRPSNGTWYIHRSSDSTIQIVTFGLNGDVPLDGDFDGDGRTDFAIYRPPVGQWWISRSSSSMLVITFGAATDRPSVGDYDKDGRTDLALFRSSKGTWNVVRSSDGFNSYFSFPFGQNGDITISAAP